MSAQSTEFDSEQYKDVQDVASFVTTTLQAKGHPNPEVWKEYLSDPVQIADACDMSKEVGVRRFLMNRALRLMLSEATDTTAARFCLVETGDIKDWCRLFDTVAEQIIKKRIGYPKDSA